MNQNESYLENAEDALKGEDFQQASQYYEQYANSIMTNDQQRAAFHFMLAAQYEKTNLRRCCDLYEKAFHIYEEQNQLVPCADIRMSIGILYANKQHKQEANEQLKQSIELYLRFVQDNLSKLSMPMPIDESDNVIDTLEKIKYIVTTFYNQATDV